MLKKTSSTLHNFFISLRPAEIASVRIEKGSFRPPEEDGIDLIGGA
jgi:hypothetical protein